MKPGLFTNEILGNADPLLTILFTGLWCMADREGRLEDRPLRMTAQIFPYRRQISEKRCDRMLQDLHNWGFIQRYQVGSARYIQVVEFLKHQSPHSKERPSIIPALTVDLHRPSPWSDTGEVGSSNGEGSGEHALTPDSGLLTPDSGQSPRAKPARPAAEPDVAEILAEYPANPHNRAHVVLAERQIRMLIDEGIVDAPTLKANTIAFRQQQDAMQRTGTKYVPKPATFFTFPRGQWVGPFDIPEDPDAARIDPSARNWKPGDT